MTSLGRAPRRKADGGAFSGGSNPASLTSFLRRSPKAAPPARESKGAFHDSPQAESSRHGRHGHGAMRAAFVPSTPASAAMRRHVPPRPDGLDFDAREPAGDAARRAGPRPAAAAGPRAGAVAAQ